MRFDSPLPERIRRMIPAEERTKETMTQEEADKIFDARTERQLQEQIANYLKMKMIYLVHSRMDKRTTTPKGTPDFIFAVNGQAVALEVKVGRNQQSEEQRVTGISMRSNGWVYEVVRCLAQVKRVLERLNQ